MSTPISTGGILAMLVRNSVRGEKGGKSGGGASRAAQEDPNTLKSVATARVIDLVSEGEVVGLANGLRSVFLDGVPVENDDGSFNFDGVSVATRVGTPAQTHIEGFPAVENEVSVDQEVLNGLPVSRSISDPDVDAMRVKVVIPALTKQDASDGDLHGSEVTIQIERQAFGGGWEMVVENTIRGKTTSDYERAYRIPKPEGGVPWNVRVIRISEDSDSDATIENKTFWGTYTEVIDAKLTYPDSAIIALAINAEQFGDKVPKREYDLQGVIVNVPSNYDPATRTYTGIWDGTFQRAWTDNPAWCYYDMITNDRYGLGEFINEASVDKGRLYQISQYCDELVPDGFGGLEPRFTLNVQIRTRDEAYTLIRKMASAFRGVTYWGSGAVIPVQDAPADYEFLATPSNVIKGKFTYGSKSLKESSTAVLVSYNDPNDGEKSAIEVYEDAASVSEFGWRQKDVSAFGCNSRGLARRTGKWEVEHSQGERMTVKFRVGLDNYRARPYSIFAIQDPLISGIRLSGRVVSASEASVYVDALPENLNESYSYTLSYVADDGAVVNVAVAGFDRALNIIQLDAAPDKIAKAYTVWMLSSAEVERMLFRVKNCAANSDNTFSIAGEQYDPNKYARVEQDLYFDEADFTDLPSGVIGVPSNLVVGEYLYRDGANIKTALTVSVTPSSDPRATLVQFQIKLVQGEAWLPGQVDGEPFYELRGVREGAEISVRARTVSRLGRRSAWIESDLYIVQGKLTPPATPVNFSATVRRDTGVVLAKDASPDVDYKETVFYLGATFETAVEVGRVAGTSVLLDTVPAGNLTFWVVDVDTDGHVSIAASAALTVDAPSAPNVSHSFEGANVIFRWDAVSSTFAIAEYRVLYDGQVIARSKAGQISLRVDWVGSREFSIDAVDIADNQGNATIENVAPTAPGAPTVAAQVFGQSVTLRYSASRGSLPTDRVLFFVGATFETAVKFDDQAGASTFVVKNEPLAGTYTYWLVARDTAGNDSPPGSTSVQVQAGDFTLYDNFDAHPSWAGVITNGLVEDGGLILLVDDAQTWDTYAAAHDTFQDRIDAGLDLYLPPATTASYVQVFDAGVVIPGTQLNTTLTTIALQGAPNVTFSVAYSEDGVEWSSEDTTGSVFAVDVRYVRLTINATGDGIAIAQILSANIQLSIQEQSERGTVVCDPADVDGTPIVLQKTWLDISAIKPTVYGTGSYTVAVNWVDEPNPSPPRFLVFDSVTGVRQAVTLGVETTGVAIA